MTEQCAVPLFCASSVCCDARCDRPGQICNQPGNEGTCVTPATGVPAGSRSSLLIGFVMLIILGALALVHRRG